jgi:hypothetical protein
VHVHMCSCAKASLRGDYACRFDSHNSPYTS